MQFHEAGLANFLKPRFVELDFELPLVILPEFACVLLFKQNAMPVQQLKSFDLAVADSSSFFKPKTTQRGSMRRGRRWPRFRL